MFDASIEMRIYEIDKTAEKLNMLISFLLKVLKMSNFSICKHVSENLKAKWLATSKDLCGKMTYARPHSLIPQRHISQGYSIPIIFSQTIIDLIFFKDSTHLFQFLFLA